MSKFSMPIGHCRRLLIWSLGAVGLLGLLFLVALGCRRGVEADPKAATGDGVRLAVLVVFDQMRGDYLTRWNDLFGEGGFHRLEKEGSWFQNCHLPYAQTLTAVGHASVATGRTPSHHGIIANDWFERSLGKDVYCVYTDRYELVPLLQGARKEQAGDWPGAWPGRLLTDTLGDALKKATGGKGRVVALSLKDRSAILLGCRTEPCDACYWFFPATGEFVTSTYYRPNGHVHPWVAKFNATRPANAWFDKPWTKFLPDLDYVRYSGPDDVAAENTGWQQGRVFPHPMTGGVEQPGESYYEALGNSPFGNDLLLEFARRAIDAERLGSRDTPDLLCLSFSANDTIGHCWGPDSQEVLDVTLRSDRIVKDLLDHLDAKVGRDHYVIAVTADHGICPLPDVARTRGKDAGFVPHDLLTTQTEDFLNRTFLPEGQKVSWLQKGPDLWIYLDPQVLRAHHLESAKVEEALAGWLRGQPGIQQAYTRTRLLKGPFSDDPIGERVRLSFHLKRSGDVTVVLKPYHILGKPLDTGTTHGSPHPYDTHVPLVIGGPGMASGIHAEASTPLTIPAILARGLEIPPPAQAAPVPESLAK
jgi:predicted AlkP superfamily pyrophosphatase or phosphodiesterase